VSVDPAVRFAILGPVRVWRDETAIYLGDRPLRLILALLLLRPHGLVLRSEVVDLLWGGDAPAGAGERADAYAEQLAALIGPARLVVDQPGYRLHLDDASLDLAGFRQTVARADASRDAGRPAQAVELYSRALNR
jgi:DNA-binding SARP family transcriptional activator